jgi:hypothetical protein
VPLDPPILDAIAADAEDGWANNPRWLGGTEPKQGRSRMVTRARRLTAG